jgi:Peptidase inhibitor I78 family
MRLQCALMFTVGAFLSTSVDGYAQQASRCVAAKAESAIGQPYSPDLAERAARSTGAREARKLTPGGAATTDLQTDRLNLHVDDQDVVRRVTCG